MAFTIEFIGISVVSFTLLLYAYIKWSHKYWARKQVPYIEATSIFGNTENPFTQKEGVAWLVKKFYEEFKQGGHIHGGFHFFTEPIYVPVDIDLIKSILTKDFPHFIGHGFDFNEKQDPLAAHLFNMEGEKWRNMRVKLTPTFTSGKMKMMFKTLLDCGIPMLDHVDNVSRNGASLDIKEIMACYSTDVIGSCAFGLECNSFKNPNAEFRSFGRKIFTPTLRNTLLQFLTFCAPGLRTKLSLKAIPSDVEAFFIGAVKNILNYRTANDIKRNDFMQLFLEIQENAKNDGVQGLTLEEIAAQAFVFFLAGFETSSTTMTFCLHELAFNQDIQDKLRKEIQLAMKENNGVLTYDAIMGMKYMDHVVNETLRKYPPVPMINRVCSIDYKVPNTDVTIEKGTKVFISSLGLHRDQEYYPNPDKFDPERFLEDNKAKRPAFSFIPFGEGPRICIGLRFGVMQTKTGLSMLLNNYRILPAPDEKYNISFDPGSFVLAKKGPIMVNVEKLEK